MTEIGGVNHTRASLRLLPPHLPLDDYVVGLFPLRNGPGLRRNPERTYPSLKHPADGLEEKSLWAV